MEVGAVINLIRTKIWFFVCCCCFSASSHCESLSVIVNPVPVFSDLDASGELSGYTIDLINGVLAEAGFSANMRPEPFARMLADLATTPRQLGASVVRTPEREASYHWLTSVTATSNQLFVKKSSYHTEHKVPSLNTLASVSVVRKDYREHILRDSNVKTIMAVNTWEQAVETLLRGRVVGIFFSAYGLNLVCKSAHLDCSSIVPVYTHSTPVSYLVLPKFDGSEELARTLSEAAVRFKNSEKFVRLSKAIIRKFNQYGLGASYEDGTLKLGSSIGSDKDEQLWVFGELAGEFAKLNGRSEMIGYNADLVQQIMHEAGMVKPILATPWKRLYKETLRKSNVLAFAVVRTPEREALFHWITPLTANEYRLFGDDEVFYTSLKQVPKDTIVAVLKLDFRGDLARNLGLTTVEYDTWEDAIAGVSNHRADMLFASQRAIEVTCEQQGRACDHIRPVSAIMNAKSWLVMSKTNTSEELVARFVRAAENVKNTRHYQKWAQQWVYDMNGRNQTDYSFKDGVIYLYQVNHK